MTITNEIAIFNFGENEIRTLVVEGDPWFVAKDVCDILEIKNQGNAVSRLEDDEKQTVRLTDTLSRNPNTTVVNEYGLYNLILGSRKPEAKAFKRWITHEVIPTIRKHGAYLTDEVLAKTLDDPNYILGLITNLAEERNKRIAAEQIIELQAPKVEAYDAFLSAENTMTLTEVGKSLGLSGIKLCMLLREIGVLLKIPHNAPAQKYLDKGYFTVIYGKKKDGNLPVLQTRVTASGVDFIHRILKSYKIAI